MPPRSQIVVLSTLAMLACSAPAEPSVAPICDLASGDPSVRFSYASYIAPGDDNPLKRILNDNGVKFFILKNNCDFYAYANDYATAPPVVQGTLSPEEIDELSRSLSPGRAQAAPDAVELASHQSAGIIRESGERTCVGDCFSREDRDRYLAAAAVAQRLALSAAPISGPLRATVSSANEPGDLPATLPLEMWPQDWTVPDENVHPMNYQDYCPGDSIEIPAGELATFFREARARYLAMEPDVTFREFIPLERGGQKFVVVFRDSVEEFEDPATGLLPFGLVVGCD